MVIESKTEELLGRIRRLEKQNQVLMQKLQQAQSGEKRFRTLYMNQQDDIAHELSEHEKELEQKNEQLEEINTALQTLVKIREKDKTEIEETVVANIHQLADPLLKRLKSSGLNERQKSYVAILEANLNEIITPFSRKITTCYLELTPAEVEVANLVKHGRKSKEIASLLNISTRTVEMHRRNIRNKLGLRNKHANLRTFLLSK